MGLLREWEACRPAHGTCRNSEDVAISEMEDSRGTMAATKEAMKKAAAPAVPHHDIHGLLIRMTAVCHAMAAVGHPHGYGAAPCATVQHTWQPWRGPSGGSSRPRVQAAEHAVPSR